ncbi:MAG: hypothetical protein M1818_004419 [Claussenomyces sp. TS43310]|nr:MAG: hypothetical protein M1818_004419 [Claussenomyces sp. TS43310]
MPEQNAPLAVEVTSSTQVFPESVQDSPTITPLSMIDSTVSYFARCAAIWFYDPPVNSKAALSASTLQASLSRTLDSYRPWCGRLSYAKPEANRGHTKRYRRVQVTFNTSTDLGVTFVTATSFKNLPDLIPSISHRKTYLRSWDPSQIPSGDLLPKTRMALSSGNPPADAPNLIVQFTTFACGSTSIGIAITHGLSDAQAMCTFAKDWASVSRTLDPPSPPPAILPVFNPALLDAAAAGDIDAETLDPLLIEEARNLPQHRFDWYKEVPGQPWPVNIPADFDHSSVLSPSDPIPWEQWDTNAPVAGRIFHFRAADIQHMHAEASRPSSSGTSKHDALLAHMWLRINAARQLAPQSPAYLDLTMGLRSRLSLPQNFLGSPLMITAIPWPLTTATPSLLTLATHIRRTLRKFTPAAIGASLHDAAFEVSPQRLWRACLGNRHILETSWIQTGFQDVDFVGDGGLSLRYVQPEMGGDGLLLVMEALGEKRGHWSVNGVDVHLFLDKGAMERLIADPKLWGEGLV